MLPIEGISVIDVTAHGPGAYASMILGDLGADIIRIAPTPTSGARQHINNAGKRSILHKAVHRNKKSILVDLKREEGRKIFLQLAAKADVIVEGFRPGVAKRLGIDYKTVSKGNSRIVYCSISGYGQDGPYKELPGHDLNYLSFGGALNLIGESDARPVIPLNLLADYGAGGKDAVIGIMAALMARGKTGRGQHIDIAMTDGVISLLTEVALSQFLDTGELPERGKHLLSGTSPYYCALETKDGRFITLACLEPHTWTNLCRVLDREDLAQFHAFYAFLSETERTKTTDEITAFLRQSFLTKTLDHWYELLAGKDIPVGKVYGLDEVVSDPQVKHREMIVEISHPTMGKIRQAGIAIKLSDTPGSVRTLPPEPGQHTDEVLTNLGYDIQEVKRLRQAGVVA